MVPLLRGVKITGFLLVVLGAAFISFLQQSRPVGAESFLLKTVQCTVGSLLGNVCNNPSAQSNAAPQASNNSSANSSSNNSQKHAGNGSASGAKNTSSTSTNTAGDAAIVGGVSGEPISSTPAPLLGVPSLPSTASQSTDMTTANSPLASLFPYGINTQSLTAKAAPSPFEASDQGWKVLGIAWYAWVGMIAWLASVIWCIRALIRSRQTSAAASL